MGGPTWVPLLVDICYISCDELALASPSNCLLNHIIPSVGWGKKQEEQEQENSWLEIKTGRLSTNYCYGQN